MIRHKDKHRFNSVRSESRISFAIRWFATEAEAIEFAAYVAETGQTYNGGWFHGMPCGRNRGFDVVDEDGNTIEFAVTER
jgi:hypothetical protein